MAHQVQHCIIGDGLEAVLLAVALLRLKQSVALVHTTLPVVESHAVAVAEATPALAALYNMAHQAWPLRPGFRPAQWRVQGMTAHQPHGGLIQTMAALSAALKEFTLLDGIACPVPTTQNILLTAVEGKITGVTADGVRVNANKVVLANGVDAYTLAKTLQRRVPLRPSRCHSIGFSYSDQITVPPTVVKLPQGHVYLLGDGPQHVQVLYTGTLDQGQSTWRADVDPEVVALVERLVQALLPKMTWQPHDQVRVWLNAVSPDGLPMTGPVEDMQGLWVCSGLDEHAVFLAPVLADMLAEGLCDHPLNPALNDMMPARIQRSTVAHNPTVSITRGEGRFVQPEGITIQKGDEHFVDTAVNIQRGEKRLVAAPEVTRGVSHLGSGAPMAADIMLPVARPPVAEQPEGAGGHHTILNDTPVVSDVLATAHQPDITPPASLETTIPMDEAPTDVPTAPLLTSVDIPGVVAVPVLEVSASAGDSAPAPDLRPSITRGEERMVEAAHVTRGDKKMVEAPKVIKGEERFVDTSSTVVRSAATLVMDEGPKVTHGSVRMDNGPTIKTRQTESKIKMPSLNGASLSDKKVTMGGLKKQAK